jgi:hypothetical protein
MQTPKIIDILTMIFCVALLSALISGCAGVTEYEVTTPDGVIVKARNTKDYQTYSLNAQKQADGSYSVTLDEEGVSASQPMNIMSQNMEKLIDMIPVASGVK